MKRNRNQPDSVYGQTTLLSLPVPKSKSPCWEMSIASKLAAPEANHTMLAAAWCATAFSAVTTAILSKTSYRPFGLFGPLGRRAKYASLELDFNNSSTYA